MACLCALLIAAAFRSFHICFHRLLAKSREPGADSIQNMYAINSLAHEDITEGNLKDFIDKACPSGRYSAMSTSCYIVTHA